LGTINPVKEIIQLAHNAGAVVLVDAAQAVQHIEHDVQALDADFYAFSGHKMYGPMGVGVLYGKEKWLDAMPPFLSGGEMISNVTPEKISFNVLPYKFEAGTPNVPGPIGLAAAIDYLQEFDEQKLRAHEDALLNYGIEKLKEILEKNIPFDSLVFKDASGTTPPQIVRDTIKKAREILGKDRIIWFHTHDTAGLGTAAIMAAVEAGADGIDLSKSPVSGGTCQPDILTIMAAFRNTNFTLDLDYQKVLKAERAFEDAMERYMIPPESRETSPLIVLSPMPGGALTANTMMMRDNKTLHLYPKVIEEMADVVAKGGFGTSVTPVSQFYFQQAYMNVVMGKWKKITDGYGNMVLGYFGKTPRPADPEIVRIASEQLKKDPFEGDPIDILPPAYESSKQVIIDNNLDASDENIFIYATCKDKGLEFLKGNAPLSVYYKEEVKPEPVKVSPPTPEPTKKSLSPENLIVTVNGKQYHVHVQPDTGEVQSYTPIPPSAPVTPAPVPPAQKPVPQHTLTSASTASPLLAPIHGVIVKVLVSENQTINEGDLVLTIEAMKMENEIYAHKSGKIDKIMVNPNQNVDEGQTLLTIR